LKNSKVKQLTLNQLIISIDRLTRFKNPQVKYVRVFADILTNNLIFPKFKKSDLEKMDNETLKTWAQYVINSSLEALGKFSDGDFSINKKLVEYEKSVFKVSKNTEQLLDNEINYKGFVELLDDDCVKNLQWLKSLATSYDIKSERQKKSFRFPVERVIIAEGVTEETLLPEFSKHLDYDFDKEGVYILSAGGKSQVVKLYYQLVETLNLPIFVLLDKDAKENVEEIKLKLRPIDTIHLVKCGEFEDLLPLNLIKKTLDYELNNISIIEEEMFNNETPRAKVLEEIFKTRGRNEFKKAEFAKSVKAQIRSKSDISEEIVEIITEIKSYHKA
jgi:hypothetical protein